MIDNPRSNVILFLVVNIFCLPVTAFAVPNSSLIKPGNFNAQTQQSYVKSDPADCIILARQGRKLVGTNWVWSSDSSSVANVCPKDKPVMVALQKGYAIETGGLAALTAVSQNAAVKCCPIAQKWVDSRTVV